MRVTSHELEVTSDLAVRVRDENRHISSGSHSITKAVMDVASPKARREQTKRRHQKTAVHAKQLLLACCAPLAGSNSLNTRNEFDDNKKIGGQVSKGAGDESQVFAASSIFPLFFKNSRPRVFPVQFGSCFLNVGVDSSGAFLIRFQLGRGRLLFTQSDAIMKFVVIVSKKKKHTPLCQA